MQSSIACEGFRSLREGEEVEFFLEMGEDGRSKAVDVTGPQGAAPQVNISIFKSLLVRHSDGRLILARGERLPCRMDWYRTSDVSCENPLLNA